MNSYFEILKTYVAEHPPDYGDQDAHSLLEFLYFRYNDYNGMDTPEIKSAFETLYQRLHGTPLQDLDKIIDTVCLLCLEHEKSGFVNGVKIGVRLKEELSKPHSPL